MHFLDHLFVVAFFVIHPIQATFAFRRYVAGVEADQPADRVRLYVETLVIEWLALFCLGLIWVGFGRAAADLGFHGPAGTGFRVGLLLLVLLTAALLYSWRHAMRMSDAEKARLRDSFGQLVHFLPSSRREFSYFVAVSITAGIVEETLYRGFGLWYLGQAMPLWAAVPVSSAAFGLAHSYQGPSGAVRTGLIGLSFALLYILTGSLWLPILGHVLLDILQGAAILEILQGSTHTARSGQAPA